MPLDELTPEQMRLLRAAEKLRPDPTQEVKDVLADPAVLDMAVGANLAAEAAGKEVRQQLDAVAKALNEHAERIKPKGFLGWLTGR